MTLSLAFVGAALAMVFLDSMWSAAVVPIAAAVFTGLYALRDLARSERRPRRAIGFAAHAALAVPYTLFLYLAVAWGGVLFWSIRWWGWAFVAITTGLALATLRRPWRGIRVPPVLPLGAWIACCLLGWRVEEGILRCDDYLGLRGDLALIAPTTRDLGECAPGAVLTIGRYPRVIWESPEGDRLVVTTQAASGGPSPDGARFHGSVCEVRGDAEPVCIGEGKAQGVAESVALDRVFFASWGRMSGGHRGELLAIPRSRPIEELGAVPTRGSLGELFYDQAADRVYAFTDEGFEAIPFVASTLTLERAIPIPLFPAGGVRYDVERGEGVVCSAGGPFAKIDGSPFISVAVRGHPFSLRALGGESMLAYTAMTWGCDWDPESRRVYVAIPNLGLLATMDYDSGDLTRTDFVGFGMRSVTVDVRRGRLYLTNFLGGYVTALDAESGAEVARWDVGRFPRVSTLSRDGRSLFVGTTVGVVAVRL